MRQLARHGCSDDCTKKGSVYEFLPPLCCHLCLVEVRPMKRFLSIVLVPRQAA
jgi:hypothetical protein